MSCYKDATCVKKELSERVYVSYSGGKDSTAMLIRMLELGERIDEIIFANTTLEYPEMYAYIRMVEKHIGRQIKWVYPKDSFYKWFYGTWTKGKHQGEIRGFPRQSVHGYCCRELKINPQRIIRGRGGIVCLGIAKDEEHRIQKGEGLRYPLIEWGWTEEDCKKYLESKNILNPLYKKFKRTGCWLCPKQPLRSLKVLYTDYPLLWQKLKKLERDSPHGFREDYTTDQLEEKFKRELSQTKLNVDKKEVAGCDVEGNDGIPSKTKVLGILPNEL